MCGAERAREEARPARLVSSANSPLCSPLLPSYTRESVQTTCKPQSDRVLCEGAEACRQR